MRQTRREFLKRFFHDLATPLSAVSLHLEGADRRARRGADPSDALAVARTELGKAFDLFDAGETDMRRVVTREGFSIRAARGDPDHAEAVRAFLEKREPNFSR